MKIIGIENLYDYDYSILVENGLKQTWEMHNTFSCISSPKTVNMLLYIEKGRAHYVSSSGLEVYAKSGDIVYTPIGCEYFVEFYDFKRPGGYTVGVNLHFFDKEWEPFKLSDDIVVFSGSDPENKVFFDKVDLSCRSAIQSPGVMKSAMYGVVSNISRACKSAPFDKKKFRIIERGIQYLENDANLALSVSEIASLCRVSEIYFRRLFKEYSGVSPTEYRISRKIERAKLLLEYEPLSIAEIADILGFTDAAYFAKVFKERVGVSPRVFRGK